MCSCDSPSVFRQAERVARKEHRCSEGEHAIHPGDRYAYASGVWDGRGSSHKLCLTCWALFEGLSLEADCGGCGPCFGELAEYVREIMR